MRCGPTPPTTGATSGADFRRITPIGRPLRIEAAFDREEGRKRFLRGALYEGDDVTVEAEGLWVELREGAP